MYIRAVLGALELELTDLSGVKVTTEEIGYYLAGVACAAVVGYIAIKTMLVAVREKKFTFFAVYCLVVGIVSIVGYFYAA